MNTLIWLSAFSLMTLLTSCKNSAEDSEVKIINGKLVEQSDATPIKKSVVFLFGLDTGMLCTGTVVAPDLILTAAHCHGSIGENSVASNTANIIKPDGNLTAVKILDRRISANYPKTSLPQEDYALVKIDPLPAGTFTVMKIGATLPNIGDTVIHAGYGKSSDAEDSTQVLRTSKSKVSGITADKVITMQVEGNGDGQVCLGDSGGPAFIVRNGEYRTFGILSFTGVDPNARTHCRGGNSGFSSPTVVLPILKQWAKEMTGREVDFVGAPPAAPKPDPKNPPKSNGTWTDKFSKKTYPYCASLNSSTGGGWGWENGKSCKLKTSCPWQNGTWTDSWSKAKFAYCSKGVKPSKGQVKWGWEGECTCRIK